MTRAQKDRIAVAVVAIIAIAAVLLLGGCGDKNSATPAKSGPSALGSLPVAESALSTMAPDAKLLVVQTAQAVEPTGTPVWTYLFGSPASDKTFLVYATGSKVMAAQEYGTAGLSDDEWKSVPSTDDIKVDSDAAYDKALTTAGGKGDPNAYFMGMLMYKSADDTSTIKPMVWQVMFDPGSSGATTDTIEVDAKTGTATVLKK